MKIPFAKNRELKPRPAGSAKNSLRINTIWMLFGQGIQMVFRAATMVLVARFLGAEQFGTFVGVTALVAVFAPFATLGTGNLLVKNVARDQALFREYWGNSLFVASASAVVLALLSLFAATIVFQGGIPLLLVILVVVADLFLVRVLDLAGQAFQGFERLDRTAQLNILLSITRFIAALFLVTLFQKRTAVSWAFLYLLSGAVSAFLGILLVHSLLGMPKLALRRVRPEMAEGAYFSVTLSAQSIYNDIDKTMLARLASFQAAGIYAAAYRIIDAAFIPVRSLLFSTYARFFRHGLAGLEASFGYAKRILPFSAIYGIAAGAGLFLLAPLVPFLLGAEYEFTVEAIRWLAPIPLLRSIHYFLADSLTGAGFQGLRSAVQIGVAIFNILVNLWLIPVYSWRGAAWASLASDFFLIVGMWGSLMILQMKGVGTVKSNSPSYATREGLH